MVILCVFREADPRNVANGPISTCRNGPSAAIIATRNFHIAQISRQTEPSRWPEVRRKLKRFFSCVKSAATTTTRSSESLAERNFALKSIARVCGSTLFTVKRRSKSIKTWPVRCCSWRAVRTLSGYNSEVGTARRWAVRGIERSDAPFR